MSETAVCKSATLNDGKRDWKANPPKTKEEGLQCIVDLHIAAMERADRTGWCELAEPSAAVPEAQKCKEECVQLGETQLHRGDCPNLPAAVIAEDLREAPIPERWQEHYRSCKENLDWKRKEGKAGHTQEIKIQLIEELSRAEETIAELVKAGNCIKHWHDWGKNNEGMVVSSEHVRLLWAAISRATGKGL